MYKQTREHLTRAHPGKGLYRLNLQAHTGDFLGILRNLNFQTRNEEKGKEKIHHNKNLLDTTSAV